MKVFNHFLLTCTSALWLWLTYKSALYFTIAIYQLNTNECLILYFWYDRDSLLQWEKQCYHVIFDYTPFQVFNLICWLVIFLRKAARSFACWHHREAWTNDVGNQYTYFQFCLIYFEKGVWQLHDRDCSLNFISSKVVFWLLMITHLYDCTEIFELYWGILRS